MTKAELIEKAKSKGYKVYDHAKNLIGVQKDKHSGYSNLVHWFDVLFENTEKEVVFFDHSYSQNTGKSYRGTMHRIKVKRKLEVD